jgi:hypothetical protein
MTSLRIARIAGVVLGVLIVPRCDWGTVANGCTKIFDSHVIILSTPERLSQIMKVTATGCWFGYCSDEAAPCTTSSCGEAPTHCPWNNLRASGHDIYTFSVAGTEQGTCTIRVEFNDGTEALETETEFELGLSECCESPCIPDDGAPGVICIGEANDGAPWDTLESWFGRSCDVVVP